MTSQAERRPPRFNRAVLALLAVLLIMGSYTTLRLWQRRHLDDALITAVRTRDADTVRDLLSQGADPTARLPALLAVEASDPATREGGFISAEREEPTVLTLAIWQASSFSEYVQNRQETSDADAIVKMLLPQHLPHDSRLLPIATRSEDVDLAKRLLAADAHDDKDQEALKWALLNKDMEMVNLLLDSGERINAPTGRTSNTPLLWAVDQKGPHSIDVVRLLLDRGAQINAADAYGNSALTTASMYRKYDMVRLLVDRGADVNVRNADAFWSVAAAGRDDMVRLFLAHGAKVNLRNTLGASILMAASNHETTIRLLLAHGADPNIVVNTDPPRIEGNIFDSTGRQRILLWPSNKGRCILADAVGNGKPDLVRFLLAHGAKVNAQSKDGYTALHWLAQNGTPTALKLLLDHGADVNARTRYGVTPLHIAARQGNTAGVAFLLDRGAQVNAQDALGTTPLMLAASAPLAKDEAVKLLLARGAAVEAQDKTGDTALHLAVYNGHTSSVQILLARGANVNARDRSGKTPLMLAEEATGGRTAIVPLLLQKGADVNARDNSGETALTKGRQNHHSARVLQMLTEAGARE